MSSTNINHIFFAVVHQKNLVYMVDQNRTAKVGELSLTMTGVPRKVDHSKPTAWMDGCFPILASNDIKLPEIPTLPSPPPKRLIEAVPFSVDDIKTAFKVGGNRSMTEEDFLSLYEKPLGVVVDYTTDRPKSVTHYAQGAYNWVPVIHENNTVKVEQWLYLGDELHKRIPIWQKK